MADQISPVCKFNTKWEKYFGADENKIKVIYNGIDPNVLFYETSAGFKEVPVVTVVGKGCSI